MKEKKSAKKLTKLKLGNQKNMLYLISLSEENIFNKKNKRKKLKSCSTYQ